MRKKKKKKKKKMMKKMMMMMMNIESIRFKIHHHEHPYVVGCYPNPSSDATNSHRPNMLFPHTPGTLKQLLWAVSSCYKERHGLQMKAVLLRKAQGVGHLLEETDEAS